MKKRCFQILSVLFSLCTFTSLTRAQVTSVVNSPHNLSSLGPGSIRAASEEQVCIFCHTPHNATPIQPLWNRQESVESYTVYSSNSLQATPGQPTGTSKMCLSCHDGTIALGSVRSRSQPIAMSGGMTTIPPGASNLGTDLSDDHPVSFKYDSTLAAKNPKIISPTALPEAMKLDGRSEMQCTTCHDSHNNINGNFLVMSNVNSQLCTTCHTNSETTVMTHTDCASCHQPHSAPSGPFLLRGRTVTQTCTTCHSSTPGPHQGKDIASDIAKFSKHDTNVPVNLVSNAPNNVGCSDCHESHSMQPGTAIAPFASPVLGKIDGVNSSNAKVVRAQYEYEVCFKCHNDQSVTRPVITRQSTTIDKRLQTASTALSYHPIQVPVRASNTPSLKPGWTPGMQMYCSDCHGSETSVKAGSTGPNGPHGSSEASLLIARYDTQDKTSENASVYALCYTCHDRNNILRDNSFKYHNKHIIEYRTPCSVCHDPHGVVPGSGIASGGGKALVNFDLSVVTADSKTKQLKFVSSGTNHGTCYLTCHGKPHSPKSY